MFEDLDFIKKIDNEQEISTEEAEYIDQALGHTTVIAEEQKVETETKECDCSDSCGKCIIP